MKTNCCHGRDSKGNKLFGGMLHATSYDQAAERATASLEVKVSPTGRAYFIDKQGREVSLYLSVHPEHTPKGQAALAEYNRKEAERRQAEWENSCPLCGRDCDCS